ncbi:MAG: tRNA pseudouridine(55) synthase TruB [Saprospiraceae bacterium]|nr:tRNA pseudouridine(55) synthase TruB [Saprospiraceae bacterium]
MTTSFVLKPGQSIPEPFPDGLVLLIDKPLGWTSFDIVNKVRYELAKRLGLKPKKLKVGHAGTLDPLATGLLVLCVGSYTKQIEKLQAMPKAYAGTFTFGATTPSFDLEKAVNEVFSIDNLSDEKLQATVPQFTGIVMQAPPVFSAIKIDGKRVYKDARTGAPVDMPERPVFIESLKIGPLYPVPVGRTEAQIISKKGASIYLHPDHAAGLQADFEVVCGKGTYIRSLANDIGMALDNGAYLSSLRRTLTGGFSVSDAWTIDAFVEACART